MGGRRVSIECYTVPEGEYNYPGDDNRDCDSEQRGAAQKNPGRQRHDPRE